MYFSRVAYCLLLTGVITLLFFQNNYQSSKTAKKISDQLASRDKLMAEEISNLPDSMLKTDQVSKLTGQFFIIDKTKEPYLLMANGANTVLYSSTNMFLICSIIFGMLTFLIAKKGWDNSNNFYLRASFLILFFAASYFGLIPKIFNQKEVGKFNLSKYFEYEKLQTQDYDYIKQSASLIAAGRVSKLDSAFSEINAKMIMLYEFTFDIYSDKVPFDFKLSTKD